jgi:hypothetical protein
MLNPYYDPQLHDLCRETMRNFLRLYFEFAFKLRDGNFNSDIVAKTNDLFIEVDDDNISTERLATLYHAAVINMLETDGLQNFCLLPIIFLKENIDNPPESDI